MKNVFAKADDRAQLGVAREREVTSLWTPFFWVMKVIVAKMAEQAASQFEIGDGDLALWVCPTDQLGCYGWVKMGMPHVEVS
jgi:uncharacterized membrane protein